MSRVRRPALLAAVVAGLVGASSCAPVPPDAGHSPSAVGASSPVGSSSAAGRSASASDGRSSVPARVQLWRDQLAQVPATAPGATVVYRRSSFGPAWQSTDSSPCRTRDQVLARTLSAVVRRTDSGCVVVSGDFTDPYTGARQHFTKERASRYPIDHVVPLGWIWAHGAWAWSDRQRLEFANDLSVPELQLTVTSANDAKGDKGPAAWLPPDRSDHCSYAAAWVEVLHAWQQRTGHVSIDPADRAALQRLLASC